MAAYPFADFPIEGDLIHPPTFLFEKELQPEDRRILLLPVEASASFAQPPPKGLIGYLRAPDRKGCS
ncbi:UNVERIFIED_CONTAM: hypothetical protein Sangu_1771000 [Sesamum angustifolium]|uniref:Uncharacterized protein n=1 Tax=Sesamum angustifolium TaxID=2727405 RepID=A0AAW2M601_9LAMI